MASTRPGKGPWQHAVGFACLKVSGEIIAREAQVGDPRSAESENRREAFGRSSRTIWTIGHSTRSLEEFVALLGEHRVQFLADVRHFPTSQRVPWTAKASLAKALSEGGIGYEHFEDLGGFRKPLPGSVNTAWRNLGFRGYADYMASPEFSGALNRLIAVAAERRTAIMCVEVSSLAALGCSRRARGARDSHPVVRQHARPPAHAIRARSRTSGQVSRDAQRGLRREPVDADGGDDPRGPHQRGTRDCRPRLAEHGGRPVPPRARTTGRGPTCLRVRTQSLDRPRAIRGRKRIPHPHVSQLRNAGFLPYGRRDPSCAVNRG